MNLGENLPVAAIGMAAGWAVERMACQILRRRMADGSPAHSPRRAGLVAVLCALLLVGLTARWGLRPQTLELSAFTVLLLLVALTDMLGWIIPNACLMLGALMRLAYLATAFALGWQVGGGSPVLELGRSLLAAVAVGGILVVFALAMDRVLRRESVGGGDVKLLSLVALYLGWHQCLIVVILSCALRLASTLLLRVARGEGAAVFPWAPSIALASWMAMLMGSALSGW